MWGRGGGRGSEHLEAPRGGGRDPRAHTRTVTSEAHGTRGGGVGQGCPVSSAPPAPPLLSATVSPSMEPSPCSVQARRAIMRCLLTAR